MDNLDPTLAEHKTLIETLKPLTKQADFGLAFKRLTEQLTRPQRFLIKMELTRLSAPCTRQIDLRGHVDGLCREYQHNGITHYMDSIAIELFEKGLDTFGHYTQGVYEQVQNAENNFKVMHKQEQQLRLQESQPGSATQNKTDSRQIKKTSYLAKPVYFGDRGSRKEERMNYAMQVELELDIDNSIQAITTDLSVSGVRIKVLKPATFSTGQRFFLRLAGLEQEYALGLKDKIQYQISHIEDKNDYVYISCERLKEDFNTKAFDQFLNNFINGNKRRYKLNLDNTIEAIITKGYEQFYLPRITSLPVFIETTPEGYLNCRYCLVTDNNDHINKHWYDEKNHNCLNHLLSHTRLKKMLSQPGRIKHSLIYAFTHVYKGRIHFYSATDSELAESEALKALFFGFASRKNNWMVYKVQMVDVSPELLQLPDTLPQSESGIHAEPPARLKQRLNRLSYLVFLTDINDEETKLNYQQNPLNIEKANVLNRFKHDRTLAVKPVQEVAIRYVNLRKESRFSYKTQVELKFAKQDAQGVTRNFSTQGLQIELAEPLGLSVGSQLKISFPELQKATSLNKNLDYQVVGINQSKTLINLKISNETNKRHKAQQFFKALIKQNQGKLKLDEESNLIPQLAEILRNICIQRIINTGYFIHKNGLKHELNTIGFSQLPNTLINILETDPEQGLFNLQPLLQNNLFNNLILDMLRRLQRDDRPKYHDLFIRVKLYESEPEKRFTARAINSFRDDEARFNFINLSCQNQTLFFGFRLYLSRTGRPDTDFVANELMYVSQYAIHKAKLLEEELWSVEGVGDILDISHELMLRYRLAEGKIKQQLIERQKQKFD